MLSALSNPNQPPLMSPESQSPGLFALAKSNVKDTMSDPNKARIVNSMMGQTMAKMGQMFAPAQIPQRPRTTDLYGTQG